MRLNGYRDQASEFVKAIEADDEDLSRILRWLDNELVGLKDAAKQGDSGRLSHQIYDLLFLLFELAARFDVDLDAEWNAGRERKREKYLG